MDKKQYNNIILGTIKREKALKNEPLKLVRKICDNLGVALPQGDCRDILNALKTNQFMGWRACTKQTAQLSANNGTAAIGISEDEIVLLSAEDDEEEVVETAAIMTLSADNSTSAASNLQYFTYSLVTTENNSYVDIPQTGNIGTVISYMGYHLITSTSSNQYKLKLHAQNSGRYAYSYPEYYAQIDGRIVIATKSNIGNQLPLAIGDYVQVKFKTDSGNIYSYSCIIGDFKGDDAPNIWGHYDGKGVVEVIYHNYSPPSGYNKNKNNPWGSGRVIRITKVGEYGNYL